LLISSSELLLLEKSVAKAFIPMLERVLVPQGKSPNQKVHSEKSKTSKPPLPGTGRRRSRSAPTSPAEKTETNAPMNTSFSGATLSEAGESLAEPDAGFDVPEAQRDYIPEEIDKDDVLRPFLESLTPGAGFRCLSLLLLQHLLTSEAGYDARIRHVLKKLGVVVLVHDMERDPVEHKILQTNGIRIARTYQYREMATLATRKFESLEHSIARRLIRLSESSKGQSSHSVRGIADTGKSKNTGITREKIVRGVKIGSAGIVAGTLFALTGGLAAPGKLINF
jgi:hypothetical protein